VSGAFEDFGEAGVLCHELPLPVVCWKLTGDAGDIMPSGTVPGTLTPLAAAPPPIEGGGSERARAIAALVSNPGFAIGA
jgi:hypothetical protein